MFLGLTDMNSDAKHKAETRKEAVKTILLNSLWFWVWIRSDEKMFSTFASKSDCKFITCVIRILY